MIDFIKKQSLFIYVCLAIALLHALVLSQVLPIAWYYLLIDGIVQACFYIAFDWLIKRVMNYGNMDALPVFQRIINCTVLGVVLTALILLCSYLLFDIVFCTIDKESIFKLLWVKFYSGIFIYWIVVNHVYYHNRESEDSEEEGEKITEEPITAHDIEILERVAIKNGKKIDVILVPNIFYIQADGDYVQIYTAEGRFMKEETMKFFQEHLPADMFVRVHRSYIVNVEKIQRIDNYEKQTQLIILKNGEKLKASAAGYKRLKLVLNL